MDDTLARVRSRVAGRLPAGLERIRGPLRHLVGAAALPRAGAAQRGTAA